MWLISTTLRVVTGKKNSLSAAHAFRKRRLKLYSVPRGISGTPCPGSYKYGGLARQFGGWAIGRRPVTTKKNLLGNLNCGLGAARLSGIDLAVEKV